MCIDLDDRLQYDLQMRQLTREQVIRYSLLVASKEFPFQSMAPMLKVSKATLSKFVNGEPAKKEAFLDAAELFCREREYWLPDLFSAHTTDCLHDIADTLANLVGFLRDSNIPFEQRATNFRDVVNLCSEIIQRDSKKPHGKSN